MLSTTKEINMTQNCKKLWASVLLRAFQDALSPTTKNNSLDVSHARSYLTSNTVDLRRVCDMAGMDVGYVMSRASAYAGDGWVTELEQGLSDARGDKISALKTLREDNLHPVRKKSATEKLLDARRRLEILKQEDRDLRKTKKIGLGGWVESP
jgi:hypothetical protein